MCYTRRVSSLRSLAREWAQQPRFLLPEVCAWLPRARQDQFAMRMWPALLAEAQELVQAQQAQAQARVQRRRQKQQQQLQQQQQQRQQKHANEPGAVQGEQVQEGHAQLKRKAGKEGKKAGKKAKVGRAQGEGGAPAQLAGSCRHGQGLHGHKHPKKGC